jgi:cytochrome c-type protein NapC
LLFENLINLETENKMTKLKEMNKYARFGVYLLIALVALFILPFLSWSIGEESFAATGDADFCESCHSMQPFVAANADNSHGGNNDYGIKAECTDCHLPHDNAVNYFFTKVETGVHDIWVETFGNPEDIDWLSKTEHREEFVYDSGCLTCHSELESATADEKEHDDYFAGRTTSKCSTCHEEVGHTNTKQHLTQSKYQ